MDLPFLGRRAAPAQVWPWHVVATSTARGTVLTAADNCRGAYFTLLSEHGKLVPDKIHG